MEQNSADEQLRDKFGVFFDSEGILRSVPTNEAATLSKGQQTDAYSYINNYVQYQLEFLYNLQNVKLPSEVNIFLSADYYENTEKLLVLIQGSGDVRAGVWSRSVCFKSSLHQGSMFPCVEYARDNGYSLIILNPNVVTDRCTHQFEHCEFVWENLIRNSSAKEIYILAHSFGGVCTTRLLLKYYDEFVSRVKAIALTDSVHAAYANNRNCEELFRRLTVHWCASTKPVNKVVSKNRKGCINISAGHNKHEFTTGTAQTSIFKFFSDISQGRSPFNLFE